MYKVKHFAFDGEIQDEEVNKWLAENPNIEIISTNLTRIDVYGELAIFYKEVK